MLLVPENAKKKTKQNKTKYLGVTVFVSEIKRAVNYLLITARPQRKTNANGCRISARKAREAHLINKAMTFEPLGINRRDEQN